MNIWNKVKVVVGVLMVFLLILATNLIDINNFEQVEESVETIYQERLFNKKYVRELTNIIHEKEIACITADTGYFNHMREISNERIDELIKSCSNEIATNREGRILDDLQEQCDVLYQMETDTTLFSETAVSNLHHQIDLIKHSLDDLANVQLEEGRKQKILSRDAMDSARLFTQIEIYFLIFLGLLIQVVILYNPKKKEEEGEG